MEAGTPYYTAPEMIQNMKYSYPVDCWSFGVLLHEMLALELPFTGATTADLVKSIVPIFIRESISFKSNSFAINLIPVE